MTVTNKRVITAVLFLILAAIFAYSVFDHFGHRPHVASVAAKVEYTCPMHPFIVKDRPGVCPICNMELVTKAGNSATLEDLNLKEHVYLSPAQQVMANLEVVTVIYKPLFKSIEAAGVINYDQTRQAKVSAWVAGRIDRLQANMVGMRVTRGNPVAELFSPELASAEEEYLGLFMRENPKERAQQLHDANSLLYWSRLKLVQLGFTATQFKELETSARPMVRIPVSPPMNGVITGKDVLEGQYVKAGDSLFTIADLSRVWGELDVYEDEFPYLKTGQEVALVSRSYPQREFTGRITYIYPFLNPKTRTNRIRVAIDNGQSLLKPDMVVSATIQVPLGTDLAVPAEAVVNTGDKNLVWVRVKPGVFIPREVTVGVRYRNDVQILSGLKKDDAVASSGAYLVDSEAQLKPGGARVGGSRDTTLPPVSSLRHAPATAGRENPASGSKGSSMDMSDMDMGDMDMSPAQGGTMARGTNKSKGH